MAEAYRVDFDTKNYHAPVYEGSSPSEAELSREKMIVDNLMGYVGEYRLGEKFDEYFYEVREDPDTQESYFASGNNEPIKKTYKKAIFEREKEGLSAYREKAEQEGFENLEKNLTNAPDRTMAVWVSPPGDKKDGYGDYSFTFIAQVVDKIDGRKIRMIPYRNEFSETDHNNYLSRLTGKEIRHQNDIDFLNSPQIVTAEGLYGPEDILEFIGEQEEFADSWREEFYLKAMPIIRWYINLVKENSSDEKLREALRALENFAIAFRDNRDVTLSDKVTSDNYDTYMGNAQGFVESWGKNLPPIARGSCGAAGDKTPTPMEMQEQFGKKERMLCCTCPFCKKEVEAKIAKGKIECPNCKKSAKWED